ncbi:MAG: SpoIID/LytB domain-containing protein [Bacteroidetes bacterium]|nr:SpoIID/LytB domain-containing protein [Bacteroidota bacterium]MCH8524846.1 SpoIID/LytB domain-containing protein [Balneolales bacterium]
MSIQLDVNHVPTHDLLRRFAHVPLWILALLVIASCAQKPPVFPDEPDIRVRILESQPHIHVESAYGFTLRADGEEIRTSSRLTIKAVAVDVEGVVGGEGAALEAEGAVLDAEGAEGDLSNETHIENRNPDAATSHNPNGNADPNRSAASLLVTDRDGGIWQASELWLESVDPEFLVEDVPFGVGWWWGGREHRTYEGRLHVYVDASGRLDAVLHLPMETYLKGVIPYEIGPESPLEALKAQAVAARSEIVQTMVTGKYRGEFHDVCADVECQVFAGNIRRSARSDSAVVLTRAEVLVDGIDVIDAYYASNCGGMSEVVEKVWPWRGGPKSYLISRYDGVDPAPSDPRIDIDAWLDNPPESWCNPHIHTELPSWSKANFRWTREMGPEDFSEGFQAVDSLQVVERGASGRIHRLIVWQEGRATELDFELAIRQMVHPPLRSSAFRWRQTGERFVFEGAGWGHGVGMCQSGALSQALTGRTYDVILEHYFPGTQLHRVF